MAGYRFACHANFATGESACRVIVAVVHIPSREFTRVGLKGCRPRSGVPPIVLADSDCGRFNCQTRLAGGIRPRRGQIGGRRPTPRHLTSLLRTPPHSVFEIPTLVGGFSPRILPGNNCLGESFPLVCRRVPGNIGCRAGTQAIVDCNLPRGCEQRTRI
jgi:hypothetical protein